MWQTSSRMIGQRQALQKEGQERNAEKKGGEKESIILSSVGKQGDLQVFGF